MVTENDLEKIEFALYVLQHPEIRGRWRYGSGWNRGNTGICWKS